MSYTYTAITYIYVIAIQLILGINFSIIFSFSGPWTSFKLNINLQTRFNFLCYKIML